MVCSLTTYFYSNTTLIAITLTLRSYIYPILFASLHFSFLGFDWKRVAINSGPKNPKDLLKKRRVSRHKGKGNTSYLSSDICSKLIDMMGAKPQHSKSPAGENSCCCYQSAIAYGEKPNNHKLNVGTPVNEKFLPKILPIYERLASNELLEKCIRCGTQNADESLLA
ncbi:uncharacterized protein TNCV_2221311 [Trichonephila clavipes]|nr:uncharacterized protein TNCV_2221311 [Trichonephila clavipes]